SVAAASSRRARRGRGSSRRQPGSSSPACRAGSSSTTDPDEERPMSTVLRTGQQIAGYRIEALLASGGMGVVYRATQLSLGRTVALKVLAPQLSSDPEFRERFRREAALQARLEHPHIVRVYETGESEEGLFLALSYVAGTDLRRLIDSRSLGAERALRLLGQVATALDAAHEAGFVHRDVKPQNVLVDDRHHAYLADFGLTKNEDARGLTQTGS